MTRISHRVKQRGGGEAVLTRLAAEDSTGVLEGTSRRPKEDNGRDICIHRCHSQLMKDAGQVQNNRRYP